MHDFETNPVKAKALKQALWFDADKTVRTQSPRILTWSISEERVEERRLY